VQQHRFLVILGAFDAPTLYAVSTTNARFPAFRNATQRNAAYSSRSTAAAACNVPQHRSNWLNVNPAVIVRVRLQRCRKQESLANAKVARDSLAHQKRILT